MINFTIHEEPGDWSEDYAFYLMLGSGRINAIGYYFGLQTDVYRPGVGGAGKGILYSRWETRDLANARAAEDGWTQQSGHEGNFIGVRRNYDWTAGDYTARLAPDGLEDDGEWYSLWITHNNTEETTWAGSLKFPLVNGMSQQHPHSYTTLEIYGGKYIRPIDIPEMHVSMEAPLADNKKPEFWEPNYSCVNDVNLSQYYA